MNTEYFISKPSEGSAGKTGEWRTFKPVIKLEKCILCLNCYDYCPENVIDLKNEQIEINYEYCKGCGICYRICPTEAIIMEEEK